MKIDLSPLERGDQQAINAEVSKLLAELSNDLSIVISVLQNQSEAYANSEDLKELERCCEVTEGYIASLRLARNIIRVQKAIAN